MGGAARAHVREIKVGPLFTDAIQRILPVPRRFS
jgi:hypothetical protein